MHPILFNIGPLAIHTYGVFLAAAFLTALFFIQRDAKRFGLDPTALSDIAFWTLLVGIIGSRLFHIIMYPSGYSWRDPLGWIALWNGGLVFHGGFISAFVFCFAYMYWKRLHIGKTFDAAVPYVPLAHAIGRMGCFLGAGCCYGARTDSPWGVCFPRIPGDPSEAATGSPAYMHQFGAGGDAAWSLPVHPTQLYEAFGLLLIFGILLFARRKWHPFHGFLLPVYMVCYGILRFNVEILRGDDNPTHFSTRLSDQQVYSLVSVLAGILIFLFFSLRRPVRATAR